jgi:hypothetical protein
VPQDDVVDTALVAKPYDSGALVREDGQAQCRVLLVVPERRLVVDLGTGGLQDAQVLVVLVRVPPERVRSARVRRRLRAVHHPR